MDNDGKIVGLSENPESVQERLTSFLHSGCGLPVVADVGRHTDGVHWVHWIDVKRQSRRSGPFQYDGRFWVRRGRASVTASPAELQELMNTFGMVLTEEQILSGTTMDDVDIGTFVAYMRRQGRQLELTPQLGIEDDLRNGGVIRAAEGYLGVTLYGMLVFGRDPQGHGRTGNLLIECSAYAGTDRGSDVIVVGRGAGRLDEQVERASGWFRSLGQQERYEDVSRRDIPRVPVQALREALVNAVIHRDYAITGSKVTLEVFSDRLVVTSPGTLPNHMTVENARRGGIPRSRNEAMANAMLVQGLMEGRGRGWLMMRRAMGEFNGTEPELINDEENRFVRVVFWLQAT